MYASKIFLGLIATVSAIDIYGYKNNEKCGGGDYIVCTNANPNDCCVRSSGDTFRSIGFRAIPTNWRIIGRAFSGGDCKNVKYVAQSNGAQNVCCGGSTYSGGNYVFASKKRDESATEDGTCAASAGGCTSVAKGNLMVFENGPKYNMTGLDDALYTELNGGSSDEIPAKFDAYKFE
ncbi:hypothetical protein CABS01_07561 [Colletotrichum abscissum]|uniref:Secreted protein n=1 Tax=Colletotrichum costaricense TaxID=1209916 RepID=A0AAJ0DX66_9PEZI|nr:uncharacterized protein CCOS01_11336 [Colletotrichum costaricense]XP_060403091.1 uncharacterized protein CABS01_07561 [Colletotrichum abscissum]KAI3528360.1 hypothetical protein CSPX01_16282 [Colletotrichum filicis]KAK1511603.1 hypothetical protein CABS01_07561 [Colletotrichum abscissum]KAK1519685.1 hypothetical protein CCOS01_11336 [Colletotrichum costaricense]